MFILGEVRFFWKLLDYFLYDVFFIKDDLLDVWVCVFDL